MRRAPASPQGGGRHADLGDWLRRGAERAAPGADRDLALALGALLCRGVGRRLLSRACQRRCVGDYDEEIDDGGDDDERYDRVDEVPVEELAVVDSEGQSPKVWLAEERGDKRSHQDRQITRL